MAIPTIRIRRNDWALLNQTQLLAKKQAEVDQLKNLLEKDEYAHNLYYENANLQK